MMCEITVYVMVDEAGEAIATTDESNLSDLYEEIVGGDHGSAKRIVKLVVKIPAPEPLEVIVNVPPESQTATVTIGK